MVANLGGALKDELRGAYNRLPGAVDQLGRGEEKSPKRLMAENMLRAPADAAMAVGRAASKLPGAVDAAILGEVNQGVAPAAVPQPVPQPGSPEFVGPMMPQGGFTPTPQAPQRRFDQAAAQLKPGEAIVQTPGGEILRPRREPTLEELGAREKQLRESGRAANQMRAPVNRATGVSGDVTNAQRIAQQRERFMRPDERQKLERDRANTYAMGVQRQRQEAAAGLAAQQQAADLAVAQAKGQAEVDAAKAGNTGVQRVKQLVRDEQGNVMYAEDGQPLMEEVILDTQTGAKRGAAPEQQDPQGQAAELREVRAMREMLPPEVRTRVTEAINAARSAVRGRELTPQELRDIVARYSPAARAQA